jgi:hypothetical protein
MVNHQGLASILEWFIQAWPWRWEHCMTRPYTRERLYGFCFILFVERMN